MRIGVDFDNTVICYDSLFYQAALEQGLIPTGISPTKKGVRDHLRLAGREADWTRLQGAVYGAWTPKAVPFPGVMGFFERCKQRGVEIFIISHKTRHPFDGPGYDLHQAAHAWLRQQGFYDSVRTGLSSDQVYFEETKEDKLGRIRELGCTRFIDDLPELLNEPSFPSATERILFDPTGGVQMAGRFQRANSWVAVERLIFDGPDSERIPAGTERILRQAGFEGEFHLDPVLQGANNRVFTVDVSGSRLLLKAYFQHPDDPRDRLGAEFSFSRFAWKRGLRCLPQPLACDPERGLGLYAFIPGRALEPSEVTEERMHEALDFYQEINQHRDSTEAASLPVAAEACFTLGAHLDCVIQRLKPLRSIADSSAEEPGAARFIRQELLAVWEDLLESVVGEVSRLGIQMESPIPQEDRRLSPSDFGFHNAILTKEGDLRFIDFEYAGWDDPAKVACDFFCQPAVPVPLDYFETFLERLVEGLSEPETHRRRARLLFPVYQVKWCCILLNEFLLIGEQRRFFAHRGRSSEERKAVQLEKARRLLNRLIQSRSAGATRTL